MLDGDDAVGAGSEGCGLPESGGAPVAGRQNDILDGASRRSDALRVDADEPAAAQRTQRLITRLHRARFAHPSRVRTISGHQRGRSSSTTGAAPPQGYSCVRRMARDDGRPSAASCRWASPGAWLSARRCSHRAPAPDELGRRTPGAEGEPRCGPMIVSPHVARAKRARCQQVPGP